MPTPIIPSAVKVTVRFTLFNQIIENVWGCHPAGAIDFAELTAIANDFASVAASDLMPALSQAVTLIDATALDISVASGVQSTFTVSPPVAGGVATDAYPSNVAFCLGLVTAAGGRSGHGRKYFSGIPVGLVVEDVVDSGFIDDMINYVGALISTTAGNAHPVAVLSPTLLAVNDVIGSRVADSFSDSQRRRLAGRGK